MKLLSYKQTTPRYTLPGWPNYIIGISLLLASVTALAQPPLYPGAQYPVGNNPESVVMGDVNSDGSPDIVSANAVSDTVSVLLGKGDGTFAPKADYAVGDGPLAVTLGDVNGDGSPDIVSANARSDTVSVLLGKGDGTFATKTNYAVGTQPRSVALGDVNGDGALDLATANFSTNNVSIMLGNGDGTFATKTNYAVGTQPLSVALGDVNGDGALDMVTAIGHYSADSVSVMLGNGDGTFANKTDFAVGNRPRSVVLGDVNGDGVLDLLTANNAYNANTVSVLLGNGDGTFKPKTGYAAGDTPVSLTLNDINGDGTVDLITATSNTYSSAVNVLLGNKDGTFAAKTAYPVGDELRSVAVSDINHDGAPDLLTAISSTNTVGVLIGRGDGTFAARAYYVAGDGAGSVALGDVDGDSMLDMVTANAESDTVSVLLGNGDGTFASKTDYVAGDGARSVALGDVDGDSTLDIVIANRSSDTVSVLLGNGDGTFASKVEYTVDSWPTFVALANINGDSVLDIITTSAWNNTISVLLGNGNGTFATTINNAMNRKSHSIALGDVNGNGVLDIVTTNTTFNIISVLLGNGDGTFAPKAEYAVDYSHSPASVALDDVNIDGVLDMITANGSYTDTSTISVMLGNGDGTFAQKTDYVASGYPNSIALNDINSDGALDIITANYESNSASVLLGNGDGTFAAKTDYALGKNAGFIALGDVNDDNRLDIVSVSPETNTVSVLLQTNISPIAENDSLVLEPDTVAYDTLVAKDANGDELAYSLVSTALHGAVTLVNSTTGDYDYAPSTGYEGLDSFTFKANDGTADSNTATISIIVTSGPIADNGSLTLDEDTVDSGSLSVRNANGDTLTYTIVTQPLHGTVNLDTVPGTYSYNPDANYNGADSFTFKADNGTVDSNVAIVSISVNPINDSHIANNDSLFIDEGGSYNGNLLVSNVDGDTLTYTIVAQPSHGYARVDTATGVYHYSPSYNFNGTDSFTFKANDGKTDSNTATISITVNNVNDAPDANNRSNSLAEDTVLSGTLPVDNVDGDNLTYAIVAQPSHGTIVLDVATGDYEYTPDANFNGYDSFTFQANDGTTDSNIARMGLHVNNVNDNPVASDGNLLLNEDTTGSGILAASDIDGDDLTYSLVTQPQYGTVTIDATTGAYDYNPDNDYHGSDSFTFKVNDGAVDSNTAMISITVYSANDDAPVATDGNLTLDEDTVGHGTLVASDNDGDDLTFSLAAQPQHGTVTIDVTNGDYIYTPDANYNGSDNFSFTASDGSVGSNTGTIEIRVNSVNDAPLASDGSLILDEDTTGYGSLMANDVDGDTLTYIIVAQVQHGTVSINAETGVYEYHPNPDFNGTDSFTFKVNDGNADSNSASISITVNPKSEENNNPPPSQPQPSGGGGGSTGLLLIAGLFGLRLLLRTKSRY